MRNLDGLGRRVDRLERRARPPARTRTDEGRRPRVGGRQGDARVPRRARRHGRVARVAALAARGGRLAPCMGTRALERRGRGAGTIFLHLALVDVNYFAAEVLADETYAGESLPDACAAAGIDPPPADYAGTARDHLEATRGSALARRRSTITSPRCTTSERGGRSSRRRSASKTVGGWPRPTASSPIRQRKNANACSSAAGTVSAARVGIGARTRAGRSRRRPRLNPWDDDTASPP